MSMADLKAEERRTYVAATDTGIWDVLLASVISLLAVAPLLSERMGDFWSSAVFVPIWIVVFALVHVVKEKLIAPKVGYVQWGEFRRSRLRRLGVAILAVNLVAFAAGLVAYRSVEGGNQDLWMFPIAFSLIVLVILSLVAYAVSVPRFFYYGVVLAACPLVGEILFRRGISPHHGFPVVFGLTSLVIGLIGIAKLVRVIRCDVPTDGDRG